MDRPLFSRRTMLRAAGGTALAAGAAGLCGPAVAVPGRGARAAGSGPTPRVGATYVVAVGRNGGLFLHYVLDSPPGNVGSCTPALAFGEPGAAPPEAGVAGVIRTEREFAVFVVDGEGRLQATLWDHALPATARRVALTSAGFAPPGAAVAAGVRAGGRREVFVVSTEGTLHVVSEDGDSSWSRPVPLTTARFAPAGAALTAGRQANDRLDLFLVGNDEILHMLSESGDSSWSRPLPLTAARFAPGGAALAAERQKNDQLDLFVVGNNGALHTLRQAADSSWARPVPLTPTRFAPPGAGVAGVTQSAQPDFRQLDAFVVGNDGVLYAVREQGNGSWAAPAKISGTGFTPGAPLSTVPYDNGYASVFVPRADKRLCEFRVLEKSGGWTGPRVLSAPGTVVPTAHTAVVHYSAEQKGDGPAPGFGALISIASTFFFRGSSNVGAQLALDAVTALRPLTVDQPFLRRQLAQWDASPTTAFLTAVGRWDEAVATADESIGLYRTLVKENPGDEELAFRLSWASIDISLHLWGKPELQPKALDLTLKAIENLRTLTTKNPTYRRQLAQWTASPATAFLTAVGRWDEADAMADESIGLYRALTKENPGDEELAYGLSWASIDISLHLWGKPELQPKALDLTLKAIENLRTLTTKNPTYRRQLAQWTASPATAFLTAVGRWDEANTMADESIGLYRTLTKENPDDDELAYLLSQSFIDISLHLWGKPELQAKARDLAVEAIDKLRPLATRTPSYRPQLADWIMSPTADFLVALGEKGRAIALVEEAVDLYTQLNAADPGTYGPKLAAAKKKLADLRG
ncbi:hypothetical protein M1P56_31420 [Streptomyces sp. HU2014]|uniref:hypothetical protein n=1 Tax=Streptomyces sp. HU2014 TaxID=2939414 RepID=UPI00200F50EF|nr:hypothetical protein [Streptomyces sp. HU2014]UQI48511.1 hypothetical protein M1P56_31420 [Streptomyces sp. HU2014]